jgi:hypothetical protein
MKHLRLGVVLLALLLVAMAMVPMVSAEENGIIIDSNQLAEESRAMSVDLKQRLFDH